MAESDDLRAFIRELMARYDRKMDRIDARMEREAAETRAYLEDIRAKTNEIIAEGRAGREALFRILDRLDGNGGTSAAG
jgi:predicted fused transcriptional regulator/phosphomethylpyrimidine kinase